MTGKSLDFNALTKTQQRFVRHLTKSEPHKVESCGTVNVAQALMRGRWIEPLEPGINQLLYHDTIRLTPAGQAAFEAAQAQPPADAAPLVSAEWNKAALEVIERLTNERDDLRARLAAADAENKALKKQVEYFKQFAERKPRRKPGGEGEVE